MIDPEAAALDMDVILSRANPVLKIMTHSGG